MVTSTGRRKKIRIEAKKFVCDYPECLKSFSRKDHLKRHQLNHDDTVQEHECEECGKKFKREDVKK